MSVCKSHNQVEPGVQGFTEKCCDWLRDFRTSMLTMSFPGGSDHKESACNVEDLGSIPALGRSPGEGHGNPLQHSCLENPHGQKSLTDYSPWDHKQWDRTEWLSTQDWVTHMWTIDEECGEVTCWWLWWYREKQQHHFHEDTLWAAHLESQSCVVCVLSWSHFHVRIKQYGLWRGKGNCAVLEILLLSLNISFRKRIHFLNSGTFFLL